MEIYLSNSGQTPIYAQITRQIKEKILSGELCEGEVLPSIRLLARQLHISVITTKRAYDDLAQEGFVQNVPGKGCFVAPQNPQLHREECLKNVETYLQQAMDAAHHGGISPDEVKEMLTLLYEA